MSDDQRTERDEYREAARRLCASANCIEEVRPMLLKVSDHANVHFCEDGAFVEVVIWIPKEQL